MFCINCMYLFTMICFRSVNSLKCYWCMDIASRCDEPTIIRDCDTEWHPYISYPKFHDIYELNNSVYAIPAVLNAEKLHKSVPRCYWVILSINGEPAMRMDCASETLNACKYHAEHGREVISCFHCQEDLCNVSFKNIPNFFFISKLKLIYLLISFVQFSYM